MKQLFKTTLVLLLMLIGLQNATAGTFVLTGSDPENKGVLNAYWGYATMSFDLNFGENVVIKKSSGVAAHLYKGDAATGTEITPDDDWRLNIGNASTSARLWAADYDAYTMSFEIDDAATYTLVIPAGVIANAAGDTNEELTLTFYGSEEAKAAAEGGSSETTALTLASSTPADGEQFTLSSGWTDMAIHLTFNKDITVVNSSANVVLQQVGGSTVEPDDGWVVTKEGTNGVHIWGSDYDSFVCSFKPAEDATYTFTIPAGIVKDADGNLNEELTITVLGPVSEKPSENEGVTIDPAEGTVASLQNFTLSFEKYQFVDIASDSYKGAAVLINDATKEETTATVSAGALLYQVKVALPEAVTAEGTYTLHIPAGKLYDGISYDEEDLPEFNFHYTIDGSVVPPVEEPEKVTANPADSSTVETLASIRLTFDYDGSVYDNAEAGDITVTDDATGDVVTTCTTTTTLVVYDNQIDVVLNDELTTAGSYTITFPAGRFTKGDFSQAEESKAFTLNYTVTGKVIENDGVTIDPAEGTVPSLQNFTLTFEKYTSVDTSMDSYKGPVVLINDDTKEEVTAKAKTGSEANTIVVTLTDEVKTNGNYTLHIPAGKLFDEASENWDDLPEYNFHYTIDTSLGINAAAGDNATEVLRVNAAGTRMTTAQKGLNIVKMSDGSVRKVIVK